MLDIQKEIKERLDSYIKSEKFTEHMDKIIQDAVNKSLESLFSYGDIRDNIKKAFQERIAINVDQIDFAHVNTIVTMLVKEKTAMAFSEPLREKLAAELNDMFAPAPAEITVQGLVDLLRDELREDNGCACAGEAESVAIEIEHHERVSGGVTIKLWDGPKKNKYLSYSSSSGDRPPSVQMYVLDNGKIGIIHDMHLKHTFATGIYGFDAKLFMMYCAGTRITDAKTCDPYLLNLELHTEY